jgi:DNA-binding CsgD family transcriptional regulator
LTPRGLGWRIATAIPMPSGEMIAFEFHRAADSGPADPKTVKQLDALRPHLSRASLLSGRLALEQARSAAMALELIGLPAAVLGSAGRPLAVNPLFERLMPQVVRDRRERLHLENAAADGLFAAALSTHASFGEGRTTHSIPMPATRTEPAMILHIVPVRGAALDVFSGAKCILVVTPVVPKAVPSAEAIQGLFDLTPAEARVARAVAEGSGLATMAAKFRVSRETVRSQVRSVLAKTGLSKRSDLASMLAGTRL